MEIFTLCSAALQEHFCVCMFAVSVLVDRALNNNYLLINLRICRHAHECVCVCVLHVLFIP